MKKILVCLSMLIVLFTAHVSDNRAETRGGKNIIEKIITQEIGLPVTIEGPFTIEEVEKRAMEEIKKSPDAPQIPFGYINEEWQEFKKKCSKNSAIYAFDSSRESWEALRGRKGYALIDNNKVIDIIITRMS